MFPRLVCLVFNTATKIKDHRALTVQKIQTFTRKYSNNVENEAIPKDTLSKMHYLDERSQRNIDKMIAENPDIARVKKILELEFEVLKQDGHNVPDNLRPRDWEEMLKLPSRFQRRKFLNFLFLIEKKKEKRVILKQENHEELEKVRQERKNTVVPDGVIMYDFAHNFMLRRITETTMNRFWNWNNLRSFMFGNKIVFDLDYESFMTPIEIKSCAKQLMESFAINRIHDYPFEMTFCNINKNGLLFKKLLSFIPTLLDDDFPINVTSKSYLDVFDNSKLVYLSPDAPNMLEKHNPDEIYIIGAYVDKGSKKPISMARAKKEKIKMAKFPIDKFVHFGSGSSKNLTINQSAAIMLDSQNCSWEKALKHIPTRKLYENRMNSLKKKIQADINNNQWNSEKLFSERGDYSKPILDSPGIRDLSHLGRNKIRGRWD